MIKRYSFAAIAGFLICFSFNYSNGQSLKNGNALLRKYLSEKDYFRLRDCYASVKSGIHPKDKLFYKAYIDNAFNRCASSQQDIEHLLNDYKSKLTASKIAGLLKLQMDNEVKLFNYNMAAKTGDRLLSIFNHSLDTAELSDIRNSNKIWHALAHVPQQQTYIESDTWLSWKRDVAGLMTIPVKANGQPSDFVFDTGANFSTISESYAKNFNMKLIKTSFALGSGTSIVTQASLAIADKLQIGNISLTNVVFLVLPDDQLIFPSAHYEIHGIIGLPVIASLKEIQIYKSGEIRIPIKTSRFGFQNMALDELIPVISLSSERDTLSYRFDTGAKQTELFYNYFNKYKDEIIINSKADTIQRGGAGGLEKIKAYHLSNFTFFIDRKKIALKSTDVLAESISNEKEYYYGNIGQDFIGSFNEMIINFKQMFINFK